MLNRRLLFASMLAWLFFSGMVSGQTLEEDAADTIHTPTARPAKGARTPDLAQVAQLIIHRTNAFRQEEDRQQVAANSQLMQTAQDFAHFMARTDKYGHTADGNRPASRARQHGYTYCMISENIAYHYSSTRLTTEELAQRFTQGWQHSPGHRQNMLEPAVTETGVAVARSPQTDFVYAVQMFGRPRSQRLTFQVANRSPAVIEYMLGERTLPLPPRSTRTHQRCRPVEVTFHWPGAQEQTTVHPHNGARYTIREDAGTFRIRTWRRPIISKQKSQPQDVR